MTAESSVPNLTARFLFALGHEFGAAQAAFTGPLSSLIDFRRDLSDDEVDLFLHTIDTQTARLTARLDELTELARLQLGHLTPRCEPVSITTLIESALSALDGVSRERVVIDHQPAAVVDIDEGRMWRVLIFLLEAALAHSPETSPVRLTISSNSASVILSIHDLADRQPMLDEAVAILDQPDRLDQFAGLALRRWAPFALHMTLCRAWVELHGGRLWIAPGDDANASPGNTVCLSLPLAKRVPLTEDPWHTSS